MMTDSEEQRFYENYNKHVKQRGLKNSQTPSDFHKACLPIARERLNIIKSYFSPGNDILEIGSSTGAFISLLPDCQTSVVEPAIDNRIYSKQFVSNKAYRDIDDIPQTESFDVICMFHVFEHIKEPIVFLKKCKSLLKRGGKVIVEVPNINDPLISIYNLKEFKDFYFQPMHPIVYSPTSLKYVFDHAGLTDSLTMLHQRYGLDNHLAWLKDRKPGGNKEFKTYFEGISEYKEALVREQKTDTIYFIATIPTSDSN